MSDPKVLPREVARLGAGHQIGARDLDPNLAPLAIVRARVRTHLELKAARDILERLARLDGLTGIANRRRFDEALQDEWRRALRSSRVLTLVIADVDHFKAFNDHYGHGGGDTCLRLMAEVLQRLCRRPSELAARYGGEEFAFLLPEVDLDGARHFVKRALNAVAILEVEGLTSPGALGLSIGAVTLIPSAKDSAQEALSIADLNLYAAKAGGRGRGVASALTRDAASELLPDSLEDLKL